MATLSRPDPGSLALEPNYVVIPRSTYAPAIRVLVTLSSSVAATLGVSQIDLKSYNSQSYVIEVECTRMTLNRGLGIFTVIIDNGQGTFNQIILGGERIDIYADFESATNQIFRGRIDNAFKGFDGSRGYYMTLVGREAPEMRDRRIVQVAENVSAHTFLSSLLTTWFSGTYTGTNLSTGMTTVLNRNYTWAEAHKIIGDTLNKSGYYGYIDFSNDLHSFTEEVNEAESVVIGQNLAAVDRYGNDVMEKRNNIIMTGNRVESAGTFNYCKSKKDSTDISAYWQKDTLVSDNSLNSQTDIETDVALKLTEMSETVTKGTLTALHGLPTLRPGQSIYCFVPYCDIQGLHIIHEFSHTITTSSWVTTVTYERKSDSQWDLMMLRDEKIQGNNSTSNNKNAMTDAFVLSFGESPSIMSHSNTQELNSTLMLATGQSSGTATSTVHLADNNITGVELRIHGQDYDASTYEYSVDNGTTWETITLDELTIPSSSNVLLKIRFNLNSDTDNPTPKIWSAWLGYKM